MSNNKSVLILLLLALSGVACSKANVGTQSPGTNVGNSANQPTTISSVDVVKATANPVEITRGASAETTVHLSIKNGYHVNANPPSYPYLKATELEFPSASGISVGFIVYPEPITKKFSFAQKPLAVYQGETALKVRLKTDNSAKSGMQSFSGTLRIQACDDQVCYAPGALNIAIPVSIK